MGTADRHTQPDGGTRATEKGEASQAHRADRPPTDDESAAADDHLSDSEKEERRSVAEHYEEMSEIGAEAKGEGRIE